MANLERAAWLERVALDVVPPMLYRRSQSCKYYGLTVSIASPGFAMVSLELEVGFHRFTRGNKGLLALNN